MKHAKQPANASLAPAPKHGPRMTVRFRNDAEVKAVRRAARRAGLTRNTWMLGALLQAALRQPKGR